MSSDREGRCRRQKLEGRARKLLKGAPEQRHEEQVEEFRRRVLAYLEEHMGEGGEAFEIYGVILRMMGMLAPPEEEERALARLASRLPPEPRPTPKASALMRRLGASPERVRDRYLEIWMQEGAERLVAYRLGDEELRVGRKLGSTRVDIWIAGELNEDEPELRSVTRHRDRDR